MRKIKMTYREDKYDQNPLLAIPSNLYALTSLRFIAAFSIVLYHFKDHFIFDVNSYTAILSKAYLAVDFFFILSGFILTHSYLKMVKENKFNFFDFMKRRFARIYPVHLVTLGLFAILGLLFHILSIEPNIPEKYSLGAIPVNIFLLQAWNLTQDGTFNTPSWSISAEWFAYLLFFPMAIMLLKVPKRAAYVFALALLPLYYYGVTSLLDKPMMALSYDFGALRIVPEFLYGMATYLVILTYSPSRKTTHYMVIVSVLTLLLCMNFYIHDLIIVYLFGFVILSFAARARHGQDHPLEKRTFVYLGEISYSMYMTHAFIYTVMFNGKDFLYGSENVAINGIILIVSILMCFPAAVIFYHLIEEPGRKLINNGFKPRGSMPKHFPHKDDGSA